MAHEIIGELRTIEPHRDVDVDIAPDLTLIDGEWIDPEKPLRAKPRRIGKPRQVKAGV